MAAAPGLPLCLLLLGLPWRVPGRLEPAASRRFSELKLCADEECSMLMYRGEALEDFTGPDCRFVNFKKGDHVYVYYKLVGTSPEVWAGSVGRIFGYFPKDLLQVVHKYTNVELQIPADETDFVCFDGGRDDFDNYNVEELLGFLDLYNSATGASEKAIEKASQPEEKPPEVSEESDPEPDSARATSEEREVVVSESTKELKERHEAQNHHPRVDSQRSQGEPSSSEPFEGVLQDKLDMSDRESNTTSSSSQLSNEPEMTDAYKLLKKEVTVDLKTKFGSTADAFVSDDETTRLVTSLEDDFDEELDAEYYVVGKEEEEESEENFDELPLLTFTDGEDLKMPVKSEAGKYSTDREQNSSEGDEVEITRPLGIRKDDKNMLTPLGETVFSAVTEGEEQTGMDFESSDSEEGEDGLVPGSKWGKPQSATGNIDPEKAEDGLLIVEVSKIYNDKNPEMDTEVHIRGKERTAEESKKDLVEGKKGLEDERKEDRTLPGSTQSSNPNSLPATEKGKEALKSAFGKKGKDLKGAAVLISKGLVTGEEPGERFSEGGSERGWEHGAAGEEMKEERATQEAAEVTPLRGGQQHNASEGVAEKEVDASVNGPKQHTLAADRPGGELKEEQLLKAQNQSRFSSPDDIGSSAGLEGEGPILGRNLSGQPDVAAAANTPGRERTGLSKDEVTGGTSGEEKSVHPRPGALGAGRTGQADGAEVPGFHTENPGAEEDGPSPEGLLEDENAVSAKQSKEKSPAVPDRPVDVNGQVSERGISGATNTTVETEEDEGKTSPILETERKNETESKEVGTPGKEPGGRVVGTEEGPPADKKAQRPAEESDLPDKRKYQTAGSGEVPQSQDPGYLKEDNPAEHPETSGLAAEPGGDPAKADQEGVDEFTAVHSLGAAAEGHEGDLHGAAHATAKPERSAHGEDLPIISSFFKEQQSLQRFQKYFDVLELEAMLQEMSRKLTSAQRDSLPYNVEKVLDKVFRAAETEILNVAETMLDSRVTEHRASGMKESNVFEEAAVLDDVQDLLYFVRYTHSTGEATGPLATAQPPEEGSGALAEEMQPRPEESFPQENTEDLKMQVPEEAGLPEQPVTSNVGLLEVLQEPKPEQDVHPGIFVTESTADNAVDGEKPLEVHAKEPASETPLENAVLLTHSSMPHLAKTLLSTLPDDVQPGPDFYGLPWKPVLITAFLGIVSFVIFFWRTILVVKSHAYQVTEQQISEKLKMLKKENADLVQKLSSYEQKIKESKKHVQETKKQNMILSDEASKFKDKIKELEETKENLNDKAKNLRLMLESEREQNAKNEDLILENKISLDKLKEVIAMNASELSEVQIALNEAKLSEEKVKSECHRVQEENAKLKKKRNQLQQEIKDLNKSHAELSEQIKSFEKSQKDLEVTLTQKDDNINALTNCITQLNRLDCESESAHQSKAGNESEDLANGEVAGDRSEKMKNQIKQMMDVSRTRTEISIVEEDLKLLQFKLRASISTKCSLEDQVKTLEDERGALQAARAGLEEENRTLKQKVEILSELYQQKETALQKKLSQEEFERREREQRLSAADEKAVSAAEEIKTYRWRIEELEDELQKTERSFKDQISANEKKAHENWLKARAAERAMAEGKREAASLRHKLVELTQKLAMLQEPVIVKPMPGRPGPPNPPRRGPLSQNGSFGPSPVSGGECSPPPRDPPTRPLSATLSRREVSRGEFDGSVPMMNSSPRSSSPSKVVDEGKQTVPQEFEGPSVPSSAPLAEHPGAVNVAAEGPPPFPGGPLMNSPLGGPIPPPIRYGPPPQLCRPPFGARPFPPPFGPGFRPPLGLREYAPGVPPGKRDVPFDPRGFVPGHPHFRPVGSPGPREYFVPGPRLPPPGHGPQDYPSPAARDSLPSSSREQPPPASQSSTQDPSPTLKQSHV